MMWNERHAEHALAAFYYAKRAEAREKDCKRLYALLHLNVDRLDRDLLYLLHIFCIFCFFHSLFVLGSQGE